MKDTMRRMRRVRETNELRFARETRRINPHLLHDIGVWALQIMIVCSIAFVCVWYFGKQVGNVGDSMKPQIKNGQTALTNRIIYDASSPRRGDIVAFQPNGNENSRYYIKRIIGLPGEKLQIKKNRVYINGKKLKESYHTAVIDDAGVASDELTLADDEYFVLGDNRENSEDSRMADIGNVKKSWILGKVWFVLTPGKQFGFIK